jgi:hypothetical protein
LFPEVPTQIYNVYIMKILLKWELPLSSYVFLTSVKTLISKDKIQYRICGFSFSSESHSGCGKHKSTDGFSESFKLAWKHLSATFSEALLHDPHDDPNFIFRDRGAGSKKRDRDLDKREDVADRGGFLSMQAGMKSEQVAGELNRALYLTPAQALPMSAAAMELNGQWYGRCCVSVRTSRKGSS